MGPEDLRAALERAYAGTGVDVDPIVGALFDDGGR